MFTCVTPVTCMRMICGCQVWPAGALPASTIAIEQPTYEGARGFLAMKEALYAEAESKDTGTLAKCVPHCVVHDS